MLLNDDESMMDGDNEGTGLWEIICRIIGGIIGRIIDGTAMFVVCDAGAGDVGTSARRHANANG